MSAPTLTDAEVAAMWDETYRRVPPITGRKVEWSEHRPIDIQWHVTFANLAFARGVAAVDVNAVKREAAREDGARLDWLESQTRNADGVDVEHEGELDHPGCEWRPEGYSVTRTSYARGDANTAWLSDRLPTLRAAIDAARAGEASK